MLKRRFRFCLNNGIYSTLTLAKPDLIDEVLNILSTGSKSELILNILGYMDLLRWTRSQIKRFINQMRQCVIENFEKNPITISYNPILLIALACEQFLFIEESKIFKFL